MCYGFFYVHLDESFGLFVFQHVLQCHTRNTVTLVLAKDNDEANLRLREAIFIHKLPPKIN